MAPSSTNITSQDSKATADDGNGDPPYMMEARDTDVCFDSLVAVSIREQVLSDEEGWSAQPGHRYYKPHASNGFYYC